VSAGDARAGKDRPNEAKEAKEAKEATTLVALVPSEDVARAVTILEDHDGVRRIELPPGPQGGRPKVEIHINPLVQGGE
jgi:hypothetical protein